jgi:hypothetical protein
MRHAAAMTREQLLTLLAQHKPVLAAAAPSPPAATGRLGRQPSSCF